MPVLCEIEKNIVLFSLEGSGFCPVLSVLCCIHNFAERTGHVLRLEVVRFGGFSSPPQVLFIYFTLNQKKFANMKWTA